jgi:predicted AAA+ superfamily ATPase
MRHRYPSRWCRTSLRTFVLTLQSAVGAHLSNAAAIGRCELSYWRDRNREVDFVVRAGRRLVAIEVKSTPRRGSLSGLAAFAQAFSPDRTLIIGGDGISIEDFLSHPVEHWILG